MKLNKMILIVIMTVFLGIFIASGCFYLKSNKDNNINNQSNEENLSKDSNENSEINNEIINEEQTHEENKDEEKNKELENKNTQPSKNNNSENKNTSSNSEKETNKYATATYEIVTENVDIKPYKYGVTQFTKIIYMIYTFADGTKEKIDTEHEINYDSTTFNATTNEMKDEAQSIVSANQNIYNDLSRQINEIRANAGLDPLILDENLTLAATIRAMEMMYAVSFDHTRPNKKPYYTVLDDLNIVHDSVVAENIEMEYENAQNLVNSMQPSTIEYKNITDARFKKIGLGMFKFDTYNNGIYWVQILTK